MDISTRKWGFPKIAVIQLPLCVVFNTQGAGGDYCRTSAMVFGQALLRALAIARTIKP